MRDIPKLEVYKVANMELSIEDYKQKPKKGEYHFFADRPHKRYHCWVNGGGLGQSDSLEDARIILFDWATARLDEDIFKFSEQLFIRLQAKRQLISADKLQDFKVGE